MDAIPENQESTRSTALGLPQKGPTLSRNDQKWELYREDIRRLYIEANSSLPMTMQKIQEAHGFSASPRKWKMKLKEWGYEKRLTQLDMRTIVAKAEKRSREGKETIFYHNGIQIADERLGNFKRRKTTKEQEPVSPSAATPEYIIYQTPRCDEFDNDFVEEAVNQLHSVTFDNPKPQQASGDQQVDSRAPDISELEAQSSLKSQDDERDVPGEKDYVVHDEQTSDPPSPILVALVPWYNEAGIYSPFEVRLNTSIPDEKCNTSKLEFDEPIQTTIDPVKMVVRSSFYDSQQASAASFENRARAYETTSQLQYATDVDTKAIQNFLSLYEERAADNILFIGRSKDLIASFYETWKKYSCSFSSNTESAKSLALAILDIGAFKESLDMYCDAMSTTRDGSIRWASGPYARKFLAAGGAKVLLQLESEFLAYLETSNQYLLYMNGADRTCFPLPGVRRSTPIGEYRYSVLYSPIEGYWYLSVKEYLASHSELPSVRQMVSPNDGYGFCPIENFQEWDTLGQEILKPFSESDPDLPIDEESLRYIITRLAYLYEGKEGAEDLIKQLRDFPRYDCAPESLIYSIREMADCYSKASDFQMADRLFAMVLRKLSCYPFSHNSHHQLRCYILYSRHISRRSPVPLSQIKSVALTLESYITCLTNHGYHLDYLEFQRAQGALTDICHYLHLSLMKKSEGDVGILPYVIFMENAIKRAKNTSDDDIPKRRTFTPPLSTIEWVRRKVGNQINSLELAIGTAGLQSRSTISTGSMMSHKYGLTYSSGSSMMGVSISEFVGE